AFTTSTLSTGDHVITAVYSGDGTYSGSAFSAIQSVVQSGPTMTVTASANPSPLGQPVTFTATLDWSGPTTPTGTVDLYDGTTWLGTAELTVVNGQALATFTTSSLGLGAHTIMAIYSGDSTYADCGASLEERITN
ncbi:MAG TPA: Ig-like domain-containing protein, partial [Gemmataceae bacterium]